MNHIKLKKRIETVETELSELIGIHSNLSSTEINKDKGYKLWTKINLLNGELNGLYWVYRREFEITGEVLMSLGFKKEYVTAEESGNDVDFHYYTFSVGEANECLLITNASDQCEVDGMYEVEFFNYEKGGIIKIETLNSLINILKYK